MELEHSWRSYYGLELKPLRRVDRGLRRSPCQSWALLSTFVLLNFWGMVRWKGRTTLQVLGYSALTLWNLSDWPEAHGWQKGEVTPVFSFPKTDELAFSAWSRAPLPSLSSLSVARAFFFLLLWFPKECLVLTFLFDSLSFQSLCFSWNQFQQAPLVFRPLWTRVFSPALIVSQVQP